MAVAREKHRSPLEGPEIMARVLVVDDTDIVRRALELALKRMGHDVESTASPLTALELAQDRPPDLALLDYRMPTMDGGTLVGAMHAALGERCPKVVFVSATSSDEIQANTKGPIRAVGYLKKPLHLDELTRLVSATLVP